MKQSLQEQTLRMKRLAGLITESEFDDEFDTIGSEGGNTLVQQKAPSKEKQVKFDANSDRDVEYLFQKLKSEGVNLQVYPQWLFNCLVEENYVVQDPATKKYEFSQEGLKMLRDMPKLKQYLVSQDETDSLEEGDETGADSSYYTDQLRKIQVGSTEYAPTIKVFANGNGSDTKHLNLNKESATVLVQWLTENFINKEDTAINEDGEWEAKQDLAQLQKDGAAVDADPRVIQLAEELAKSCQSVEDLITKANAFLKQYDITSSDEASAIVQKAATILKGKK